MNRKNHFFTAKMITISCQSSLRIDLVRSGKMQYATICIDDYMKQKHQFFNGMNWGHNYLSNPNRSFLPQSQSLENQK